MVYLILNEFLFRQDHSCFDSTQSLKEGVFGFFIFSLTCFLAFLSYLLLFNLFLFDFQNEFYENLNKLKGILINFEQTYFNWVNHVSNFNLHFYLKNIFLLKMLNETQNNQFYFLDLNLKILDFGIHLNSTRVIIYYFNILLFKVI